MVEPIINFSFLIYSSIISETWWKKLQTAENKPLRMVTGCHASTPINYLHQECKIIPVKEHVEMLSKQFLANAMQPHHPSHNIVMAPPAARPQMKPSLQTKYGKSLTPYLRDGVVTHTSYKKVLSAIHMSDTEAAIAKFAPSKVIDIKQEQTLSRQHRTTLRQLRSSKCKGLTVRVFYICKRWGKRFISIG
jgi:hypothetical protein